MKKILYFAAVLVFLISAPLNAQVSQMPPCPIVSSSTTAPQSIDNLSGHFNNKIKIIFSDIDGTLTPFDKINLKVIIPEGLNVSVKKLQQAKIPLILVTGRSCTVAKSISNKIGNKNGYIIGFQGAEIINPQGKLIYKNDINRKEMKRIVNEIALFNEYHSQKSKVMIFTDEKIYTLEEFHIPYLLEKVKKVQSVEEIPNETVFKVEILEPDFEKLKLIQTHLKRFLPDYRVDIVSDSFIDIYRKDSSKGYAVKKLAEILKTDLKNIAVFGDAENDVSMFKEVKASGGLAVAVDNAMAAVKANANYITLSAAQCGFAKAVDKILENNASIK